MSEFKLKLKNVIIVCNPFRFFYLLILVILLKVREEYYNNLTMKFSQNVK